MFQLKNKWSVLFFFFSLVFIFFINYISKPFSSKELFHFYIYEYKTYEKTEYQIYFPYGVFWKGNILGNGTILSSAAFSSFFGFYPPVGLYRNKEKSKFVKKGDIIFVKCYTFFGEDVYKKIDLKNKRIIIFNKEGKTLINHPLSRWDLYFVEKVLSSPHPREFVCVFDYVEY